MLRQRVITALLIAAPVLAILLLAPKSWTIVFFALVLALGTWEWSGFLRFTRTSTRISYVVLLVISMLLCWFLVPQWLSLQTILIAAWVWWLFALCWLVFAPQSISRWMVALAGALVLAPVWIALIQLQLHTARGPEWILFLFLMVVSADIGGFFFGRQFGQHKLAPRVSPGKTWEGVVGGIILSMLIATLGAYWFEMRWQSFVPLCLVTVIMSIVGDLTESLFKRYAGLKDSSTLLPGHGGVLDRIDSLTAAAPVFLSGLMYLGVVSP